MAGVLLAGLAPGLTAAEPAPPGDIGPRIQFARPEHDFGRIASGLVLKFDYVFTNTGTAPLIISHVQPSCGCTTAGTWTREVAPGQTGTIPIQFNSTQFNGAVAKSVTVTSNDKQQPVVVLHLKATIWKPIEVTPLFAVLNASVENPGAATTTIRIVNNLEEPLVLANLAVSNPSFAVSLATNVPGREFQVHVRLVPPLTPGNIQAQIGLTTSYTNTPALSITAMAMIQPSIVISPSQIMLPGFISSGVQPYVISIRNNGTNAITLSEPAASSEQIELKLRETEPGRQYILTAAFPQGFDIPNGKNEEITLKSTRPDSPVIRIPVSQVPHASPPARPGPVNGH